MLLLPAYTIFGSSGQELRVFLVSADQCQEKEEKAAGDKAVVQVLGRIRRDEEEGECGADGHGSSLSESGIADALA